MAKLIEITRDASGVTFETVSIPKSELVFWSNQDPKEPHWPSLTSNQLGPAPSPNSSKTPVSQPSPPNPLEPNALFSVVYTCKIDKHEKEKGTINVFDDFQAGATALPAATKGTAIAPQAVAKGGKSPYTLTEVIFQVTNAQGQVIQSGSGPGPGLSLVASSDNSGITVTGTPSVAGAYTFTFNATDGMGLNVQQNQCTMAVS